MQSSSRFLFLEIRMKSQVERFERLGIIRRIKRSLLVEKAEKKRKCEDRIGKVKRKRRIQNGGWFGSGEEGGDEIERGVNS